MPIATLGLGAVGMIARTTRSSMLDVINQDYIRTARAYGMSKVKIICQYAFKNGLIPVLTAIGLRFGSLLEAFYNWGFHGCPSLTDLHPWVY